MNIPEFDGKTTKVSVRGEQAGGRLLAVVEQSLNQQQNLNRIDGFFSGRESETLIKRKNPDKHEPGVSEGVELPAKAELEQTNLEKGVVV